MEDAQGSGLRIQPRKHIGEWVMFQLEEAWQRSFRRSVQESLCINQERLGRSCKVSSNP